MRKRPSQRPSENHMTANLEIQYPRHLPKGLPVVKLKEWMFFGHRKKHTHIRLARESQVSPKTFQLRASVLGTTLEMKFGGGLGLRCLPLQDDLHYPSSDNHGSGENGCISSNVGHTNSGLEMLRDDNLQASTAGAHKKHILMTGHQSHLQLMQNDCQYYSCILARTIFPYQFKASAIGWVLKDTKSTPTSRLHHDRSQISCNPLLVLIIYYQHIQLFLWFMGPF